MARALWKGWLADLLPRIRREGREEHHSGWVSGSGLVGLVEECWRDWILGRRELIKWERALPPLSKPVLAVKMPVPIL